MVPPRYGLAVADVAVGGHDPPGHGEEQRHRDLGDRVGVAARAPAAPGSPPRCAPATSTLVGSPRHEPMASSGRSRTGPRRSRTPRRGGRRPRLRSGRPAARRCRAAWAAGRSTGRARRRRGPRAIANPSPRNGRRHERSMFLLVLLAHCGAGYLRRPCRGVHVWLPDQQSSVDKLVAVKTVDELTSRFREQGYRVTPQRQAIFRLLHGVDTHPTVESLFEAARAEMPTISRKTVYQTVHDLEAMGEVALLDVGTGSDPRRPERRTRAPSPRVHALRRRARRAARRRRPPRARPLPPRVPGRGGRGRVPRPVRVVRDVDARVSSHA